MFCWKFHLLSNSKRIVEKWLRFGKVITKIQHHPFLRHSAIDIYLFPVIYYFCILVSNVYY